MEEKQYLQDIQEIKNLMKRSTQFISLSGFSGILAGVYALIGAYAVYSILQQARDLYGGSILLITDRNFMLISAIGLTVMVLSIVTAFIFTRIKAKKHGEQIWDSTSKRLIGNFAIPLLTGGVVVLLMLNGGYFSLIAPSMLIFYGLACVNAGKYTLREFWYLGITMTIIGLIAAALPDYGLHFWALGFGICHIIYGSVMYFKYERN